MSTLTKIFDIFERYNMVKTFLLILVLTILLLYLLGWPGCILAAAIGGFFTRSFTRAALTGFLAGLIAWLIPIAILLPLGGLAVLDLFGAIAGLEGMGFILAIIILLIGGLLGLVGSLLGNAVFSLFEDRISSS
ncbi:MAG: hypothetical protein ACFFDP_08150 [Promethearchaeota archaeon]